jgi:hypothetical protein
LVYFQPHIDTKINKLQKKITHLTVLVAPLDWGLGHTTRCIPIIKALLAQGCNVILAGENAQKYIFEQEFPQIKVLGLKGYGIRYSEKGSLFFFKMLKQFPQILHAIIGENRWLENIVEQEKIDLIISDNRYGLYHRKVPTVFITHQLQLHLKNRFLEKISQFFLYRWINKFNYCWVPDMADGIAGKLSHPTQLPKIPVTYIKLLSRFSSIETTIKYKYCFLISGPEPQRTIFEEKVFEVVRELQEPVAIVRGLPKRGYEIRDAGYEEKVVKGNNSYLETRNSHPVYPHLPTTELAALIQQSEFIVCRSGYTSLMELLVLKKKLIVVPTPNQTEQEYLAEILLQQHKIFATTQAKFSAGTLHEANSFGYVFHDLITFQETDMQPLLAAIYVDNQIPS